MFTRLGISFFNRQEQRSLCLNADIRAGLTLDVSLSFYLTRQLERQ